MIDAFLADHFIYLVPYNVNHDIICFDIETNRIIRSISLLSHLELGRGEMLSDVHCYNGFIYFSVKGRNAIYRVNKNLTEADIYYQSNIMIGGFIFDDDVLWLRSEEGYSVNKINKDMTVCAYCEHTISDIKYPETKGKIICIDHKPILIPGTSGVIGYLNQNGIIDNFTVTGNISLNEKYKNSIFSFGGIQVGNDYLIYPWRCSDLILIDYANLICKSIKIDFDGDFEKEYLRMHVKNEGIIFESQDFSLDNYLKSFYS